MSDFALEISSGGTTDASLPVRADGGWANRPFPRQPYQPFAYEADSVLSQDIGGWLPWVRSADSEINPHRDRRVARQRDMVRNDGWVAGGLDRILDGAIGGHFRLISKPMVTLLQRENKACDDAWAEEFAQAVEAEWSVYADDPNRWNDAERKQTTTQQMRLLLAHKVIDGENLGVLRWNPENIGAGAARFATNLAVVDPDRLSNPYQMVDTRTMRNGVELDNDAGAPIAYHIRRAHQDDWYNAVESMEWDRVARWTPWGRPIVIHDFDRERAGQSRGVGILAPVLARLKMVSKYDQAELQQALLQTIYGFFTTSPYDPSLIRDSLEGGNSEGELYHAFRSSFDRSKLHINGVRIPLLAPGEKIETVSPSHPGKNFPDFEHAMLRNAAVRFGLTAEEFTGDFSRTNYSSLRGAMLITYKTAQRRARDFAAGTATPIYAAWLEELIAQRRVPMPWNAPDYRDFRAAYSRCRWIGPGRGWVDPVKERQGAVLGLDAGFSTLEDTCAEMSGMDWREALNQRAKEIARMKALGLHPPVWTGVPVTGEEPANETDRKPLAA